MKKIIKITAILCLLITINLVNVKVDNANIYKTTHSKQSIDLLKVKLLKNPPNILLTYFYLSGIDNVPKITVLKSIENTNINEITNTEIIENIKVEEIKPIEEKPNIIDTSNYNEEIDCNTYNKQLLDNINNLRNSLGLNTLIIDSTLNSIANIRAVEISNLWSHTRPDGTQGLDLINKNLWAGENLSKIFVNKDSFIGNELEQISTANKIFETLKSSQTHYDNMVFEKFTKIGIQTYCKMNNDTLEIYTCYSFSN